jgi:hypothetical protein
LSSYEKFIIFFENDKFLPPYHTAFTGARERMLGTVHKHRVVWRLGLNAVPYGANGIVLQNFRWHIYFKKLKKNIKNPNALRSRPS